MNIRIDISALRHPSESELLWTGALFGLKHLQELGYKLSFESDSLPKRLQKLLSNEMIASDSFPADETDLHIKAESGQLSASGENDVVISADNWTTLSREIAFPSRKASHSRSTSETDITISLNLDGTGKSNIDTGLGFFDHMLEQIARHGLVDLEIHCDGDLDIDEHHTIEDTAITLGETIIQALGKKVGIRRYAFALPMDESQCRVALDISGRPYLVFDGDFKREMVGDFPTEMTEHFFYSLAMHMKSTLHITLEGSNDHHKIEACFKAFAQCLRAAVSRSERNLNILPSTKDLL